MLCGENKDRCLGVCHPAQFFPYFFLLAEAKLGISITSLVDGLEIDFKVRRYKYHAESQEDKVTCQMNTDGSIQLGFKVEAGRSYCLEYSADMVTWSSCGTTIPVSQTDTQITVTDDGENTYPHPNMAAQRFYRLVKITEP